MPAGHTHLHDPQTLYRHWEEGQWNPWEVDLGADGADWDALGASAEEIREFALGGLSRRLNIVGVPLSSL